MQNGYNENITSSDNNVSNTTVVQTDIGSTNGQNKCPKCGSTDIELNINNGKLRCNFCRHEFEPEKVAGMQENLHQLQGQIMGSGTTDIVADTNDIMTFKCSSCGAEVVIDTASSTQARCHWCRNTLSVNQQIPNGSIPDVVLPFKITKEEAEKAIESFVKKRKFFAHPNFKKEFTTNNIMGVYFPYMIIDINTHVKLTGQGEKLVRTYYVDNGNSRIAYYDADLYNVEREFDLIINGLTVESNSDKLNKSATDKTNNVINAIMPFDIENCVKYDANYLKGYTSEKRDINVDQLKTLVDAQTKDIAKFSANNSLTEYNRGVAWSNQENDVKGQQWKAGYLPVWLYSYQQVKDNKQILHYVAVNARTKETMGSVPIHMPKLFGFSFLIEILGILAFYFTDFEYNWLFLFVGFLYFWLIFLRYRNSDSRHKYETETKTEVTNLRKVDKLITRRTNLTNSRIQGANNDTIGKETIGKNIINTIADQNLMVSIIKDGIDNIEKKEDK